jgi:membrane associated rhomboid family serine protease
MYARQYSNNGGFLLGSPSDIPVTITVIAAAGIYFLLDFFRVHLPLYCDLQYAASTPWTFLTYIIAQHANQGAGFISLLFNGLWLWWVGGSLERSWGRNAYIAFLITITLAASVPLWIGGFLLKTSWLLAGFSLPLVGITVAWAAINPHAELYFYFVIKIQAWVLALLLVGFMLFMEFQGAPVLGLFALVNPLIGYMWTKGNIASIFSGARRIPRGPDLRFFDADSKRQSRPLDDLKGRSLRGPWGAYQDWKQRKRLEKLWKDSGFSDRDDPKDKR